MSVDSIIRDYHAEMDAHRYRERKRIKSLKDSVSGLAAIEKAIDDLAIRGIKKRLAGEIADADIQKEIEALKTKKNAVLKAQHINIDDFRVREHCTLCHDTGYASGTMCICLKKRISRAAFSQYDPAPLSKEENFDSFRLDVYPEQKDGIPVRNMMAGVVGTFRDYCARFDGIDENYLFTGAPGLGKTFLSGCIAGELIEQGYLVIYLTAEHIVDALINQMRSKDNIGMSEVLQSCDLLIIDDFGAEYSSDFSAKQLFSVINDRLLAGGKMIISTNLSLSEIMQLYDGRLASRIAGNFKPIGFFGNDIRLITRRESLRK